ncbi:hypothetical protein DF186_15305 [Enterococcus hirae]|nr:hypothetical protein DF186_15305 [Enterococcus hirae]
MFRVCEREIVEGEYVNAGFVNGAASMEGSERGCVGCESDEEVCVEGTKEGCNRGFRERVRCEGSQK